MFQADTGTLALVQQPISVHIMTHNSEQFHRYAQERKMMSDVTDHTPGTPVHASWIGSVQNGFFFATEGDIHQGCSDANDRTGMYGHKGRANIV
jgi:hypothetical protein